MYFHLHENNYFTHLDFSTSSLYISWYLFIVWYVSRNVLPSNWPTPHLSANCYLVTFISTMSELINGSLLQASAALLSGPLIYFISGPYSSTIRYQRSTISVVKFLNMRFLWSVYTGIWCHKIVVRNYFKFSTIINNYFSVVV